MSNLNGKILVTGAAGGLGTAISRAFAPSASAMLLAGRRLDQLSHLAAELGASTIAADMELRDEVEQLARAASDVDVAVLNAALPASGDIMEYGIDQIDRAIEVNLRAQIVLARLLAEPMIERGSGHIIFISSLSGKAASAGTTLYSATKFGLRGASLAMRQDLAPRGVGVSVICPGFVSDAGMFADAGAKLPRGLGTVTPERVAEATVRAVEKNLAEVDVAPLALKLGAAVAQLSPSLYAKATANTGGHRLSKHMSEQQKHKR